MQLDFPKIQPLTFSSLAADGPDAANPGTPLLARSSSVPPATPLVRPNLPRWPVPATYDRWLLSATADLPRPATGGYDRTVERFDEIGRIRPLEVAL